MPTTMSVPMSLPASCRHRRAERSVYRRPSHYKNPSRAHLRRRNGAWDEGLDGREGQRHAHVDVSEPPAVGPVPRVAKERGQERVSGRRRRQRSCRCPAGRIQLRRASPRITRGLRLWRLLWRGRVCQRRPTQRLDLGGGSTAPLAKAGTGVAAATTCCERAASERGAQPPVSPQHGEGGYGQQRDDGDDGCHGEVRCGPVRARVAHVERVRAEQWH